MPDDSTRLRRPGLASWLKQLRRTSRFYTEHWRIGYIDAPIQALLDESFNPRIEWITPVEPAGYWADPFAVPGHADRIFAERFDEASGLGQIELLTLANPPGATPVQREPVTGCDGSLVGRGAHASFPNAFHIDGVDYGLAETGAIRELCLYRIDASGRWHSPRPIMKDVIAADPAIFKRDGLYWLAYTDGDRGFHDNLVLHWSRTIEGPWIPHAVNPVVTGASYSRMAGAFFEHEGSLYRPAQDCTDTYGAAVSIMRVMNLSPDAYEETLVRRLAPQPDGPLPDGLHTVSAWGGRTLVDGKRLVLNPSVIRRRIANVLLRKLRRR